MSEESQRKSQAHWRARRARHRQQQRTWEAWEEHLDKVLHYVKALHYLQQEKLSGTPSPAEPARWTVALPLLGQQNCPSCGDAVPDAEIQSYGVCENCFATAETDRQVRDDERKHMTDNAPKKPRGFHIRRGNAFPGVIGNEDVDYFGRHSGR